MSDPNQTPPSSTDSSQTLPEVEVSLTADVASISELFDRDPKLWSDSDMDRMISHWRKLRLEHKQAEVVGKGKAKAAVPKEAVEGLGADDLLKSLGL